MASLPSPATPASSALRSNSTVRGFLVTLASEGVALACSLVSFVVLVLLIPAREYGEYAGILGITTSVGALMWQAVPLVVLEATARRTDAWFETLGHAWFSLGVSYPLALAITVLLTHVMIPTARVWIAALVVTGDLALWFTHSIAASRQARFGMRPAAGVRSSVAVVRALGLIIGALISTRLGVVVITSSVLSWVAAGVLLVRGSAAWPLKPGRPFVSSLTGYQVGGSAASIQEEIDKTFVLRIAGEHPAAQYAAVFRLFQVLALPLRALAGTMHARLVVHQSNPREAVRKLTRLSLVTVGYGLAAWCLLGLASVPLTGRVAERFGSDRSLFLILGAILPVRGVVPHAANLLVGLGRRVARAIAQLVGCVVAIAMYVTLIPRMGGKGAAVASLLGEVTVLLMLLLALAGTRNRPKHMARGHRPPRHASSAASARSIASEPPA